MRLTEEEGSCCEFEAVGDDCLKVCGEEELPLPWYKGFELFCEFPLLDGLKLPLSLSSSSPVTNKLNFKLIKQIYH